MKKGIFTRTSMKINDSVEGQTIEQKVTRALANKEQIGDGAPLLYTERSEGVVQAYDPRTDRWELGIEAMEKAEKSRQAKRMANIYAYGVSL